MGQTVCMSTGSLSGGTACTNTVFGDPAPGVPKQCSIPATSTTSDLDRLCIGRRLLRI